MTSNEETTKLFSIDVETNGLWGQPFAIAAVVIEDATGSAKRVATFTARCPIEVGTLVVNTATTFETPPDLIAGIPAIKSSSTNEERRTTVIDAWIVENVLPAIESMPETHETLDEMLAAFAVFWHAHREGATVIAHVPFPVETGVFHAMHRVKLIGDWEAPFPLIDVGSMLHAHGKDASEAEAFLKNEIGGLKHITAFTKECGGSTHNPLYDCLVAAKVYLKLLEAS
jgi:hypothetical protein